MGIFQVADRPIHEPGFTFAFRDTRGPVVDPGQGMPASGYVYLGDREANEVNQAILDSIEKGRHEWPRWRDGLVAHGWTPPETLAEIVAGFEERIAGLERKLESTRTAHDAMARTFSIVNTAATDEPEVITDRGAPALQPGKPAAKKPKEAAAA